MLRGCLFPRFRRAVFMRSFANCQFAALNRRGREYRSTNRSITRNNNRRRGIRCVGFVIAPSGVRRILWHSLEFVAANAHVQGSLYRRIAVVVHCLWLVIKLQYATPHSFSVNPLLPVTITVREPSYPFRLVAKPQPTTIEKPQFGKETPPYSVGVGKIARRFHRHCVFCMV